MDKQDKLNAEIICIIKRAINQPLHENDSMATKENWDSMAQLTILTHIEKEYNVEFDLDELENVDSVLGWINSLKMKIKQ